MTEFRNYEELLIERLQDPKEAAAYLSIAFEEFIEDNDRASFLNALRIIAQTKIGITALAKKTNLNRAAIYKALSSKGNPTLDTIGSIIKELGFKINIEAITPNSHNKYL